MLLLLLPRSKSLISDAQSCSLQIGACGMHMVQRRDGVGVNIEFVLQFSVEVVWVMDKKPSFQPHL